MSIHRPPSDLAAGSAQWLSRRSLCLLLLLFAAAVASSFWVEIVKNTLESVDKGAAAVEPEFAAYTGAHNFDFFQYYAGGHNWRIGLDPYENHPTDLAAIQHPRHEDKSISGYIYPPTVLPLFGAVSRLDYEDARHTWFAMTVAFLAMSVALAVAVTPGRRLELLTAAVFLTMCSYPLLFHVHQGQIDLIVASLSVSAFLLYPRWRGWPSAVLIAAAILIKVTPLLLMAVMVVYFRDVRLLLKTLVCLGAGLALSLLAVSPHLYVEYVGTTLPRISGSSPDRFNQTRGAVLVHLAGDGEGHVGIRLCGAPLPHLRRGEKPRAAAGRGAQRRRANGEPCGAHAGGAHDPHLLAARLADGLRRGDRAGGGAARCSAAVPPPVGDPWPSASAWPS